MSLPTRTPADVFTERLPVVPAAQREAQRLADGPAPLFVPQGRDVRVESVTLRVVEPPPSGWFTATAPSDLPPMVALPCLEDLAHAAFILRCAALPMDLPTPVADWLDWWARAQAPMPESGTG